MGAGRKEPVEGRLTPGVTLSGRPAAAPCTPPPPPLRPTMLKWLVAREGEGLPTITDDPLATIPRAKKDRKNEIYSVNR